MSVWVSLAPKSVRPANWISVSATPSHASSSILPARKMRMRFAVDGGLLGGLVARIGSTVYDGSVRGQLEALGKRLLAE